MATISKGGCRTVEIVGGPPECADWRDRAISMINEDPPDIIVMGNASASIRDWPQKLRTTINQLPERSKIVVIADTPRMGSPMPICLSAHLRSANACSRPRDKALNEANREAERQLGVGILDVTDYLCNGEYCPPIIGDLLVYRDEGHLCRPFAEALAPAVRNQLLK